MQKNNIDSSEIISSIIIFLVMLVDAWINLQGYACAAELLVLISNKIFEVESECVETNGSGAARRRKYAKL